MKQIRLLPVVIVAAVALLVLKGVGLLTEGGYVLTGTTTVAAAGEAATESDESGIDPTVTLPSAPTLENADPTLNDDAPTLRFGGPDGDGGDAHGDTPPAIEDVLRREPQGGAAAAVLCGKSDEPTEDCLADAVNEHGDALPLTTDGAGNVMPLEPEAGQGSEAAILERLAERRGALDARESELEMRLALVEAAEKRIEERTASLQALEARINAMVDEKRVLEEKQFVAVVAMYELMKPKDAAAIFDQLELDVLLRVARSMSPRKMAPILAKMDPRKAKDLTAGMAVDQVEATIDLGGENLAALPQIVGQ